MTSNIGKLLTTNLQMWLLNLKTLLQKGILEIHLSYRFIQLTLFWVFGFYGWGVLGGHTLAISTFNLSSNIVIAISMLRIFKSRNYFETLSGFRFVIKSKHFVYLLISSVVFSFVNRTTIKNPLTIDEVAYAWAAQGHAYALLFESVQLLGIELKNFPSNNYIHLISLLLISTLLVFFRMLLKIQSERIFVFVVIVGLIALRVCISLLSFGETGHHAPLAFAWSWGFTSFFGFSSNTFRISSILLFSFLAVYLSCRLKYENRLQTLIVALTVSLLFTTPLLRFMSQGIEVANWTFVITIILFVELMHKKFLLSSEQLVFFAILSYVRIDLIFLILVLLLMTFIKLRADPRLAISQISPALSVILPAVFISALLGIRDRSNEHSSIETLSLNLQNAIHSLSDSKSLAYLPFFLVSLYWLFNRRVSRLFVVMVVMSYLVLFLLLNESNFSFSAKYLIEWYFPFVFFAPFLALRTFGRNSILPRCLLVMFLIVANLVGAYNSSVIKNDYRNIYREKTGAISSSYSVLPFTPFAYDQAFGHIKARNSRLCLNVGAVYSLFPEILSGLPLNYLYAMKIKREEFTDSLRQEAEGWASVSADSLKRVNLSCVILGAVENQAEALVNLKNNGWAIEKTFRNADFGTSVYVLTELKP